MNIAVSEIGGGMGVLHNAGSTPNPFLQLCEHPNHGPTLPRRKVGGSALASYSYTDRNHYLLALDYANGDKVQYTYNKLGQMLTETINGTTYTYTYDKVGNLTSYAGIPMTYNSC